eukprot:54119_1
MSPLLYCLSTVLVVHVICHSSKPSLIHAGVIATTLESQYTNQTILCVVNEPCTVLCQTLYACKLSTIWCPVSHACDVKCNESFACARAVIHAQWSSSFRLLDCKQGSWTCRGITIYFPASNQDVPVSQIIGADFGLIGYRQPLEFHAPNGWKDVNVTTDPSFSFTQYHLGTMHCITKYNHPTTCDFAPDAWACANANDTCNDPGTLTPSASPTRFPSLQPTHYPSGSPSLNPTKTPTVAPSLYPTLQPSSTPTISPSNDPTLHPTHLPTVPTLLPSYNPTVATTPRTHTTGTVTIASTNIIQSTKANYDGSISTPIDCAYITFLERCLNSVFYAFGAVSLTWYIFKFVQRRRKRSNKCLYCIGLIFYFVILLAFMCWVASSALYCINSDISSKTLVLGAVLYGLQYLVLLFILFYRIDIIFEHTIYAPRKCTKATFYTMYATTICAVFINLFIQYFSKEANNAKISGSIHAVTFLLLLIMVITLVVLLVSKLIAINKQTEDTRMISVATKNTVLTVASILSLLMVLFYMGILIMIGGSDSEHTVFVRGCIVATDLYTNFVSVIFGFEAFEKHYMMICGNCHRKCIGCCIIFGHEKISDEQTSQNRVVYYGSSEMAASSQRID